MGQIRKISVGKDYPDKVLHYQVGTNFNVMGVGYKVIEILEKRDVNIGALYYELFISDGDVKVLWKSISGVPVVVEYNINFE